MAPVVDGDTAEVTARVRAMHHGVGPRAGKFYESLGIQPTRLVRTPEGWRISHHEWKIAVKLGDRGGAVRARDRRGQAALSGWIAACPSTPASRSTASAR